MASVLEAITGESYADYESETCWNRRVIDMRIKGGVLQMLVAEDFNKSKGFNLVEGGQRETWIDVPSEE